MLVTKMTEKFTNHSKTWFLECIICSIGRLFSKFNSTELWQFRQFSQRRFCKLPQVNHLTHCEIAIVIFFIEINTKYLKNALSGNLENIENLHQNRDRFYEVKPRKSRCRRVFSNRIAQCWPFFLKKIYFIFSSLTPVSTILKES